MTLRRDNLHDQPLDSLARGCEQQTSQFQHNRESEDSPCFEIFRRAILEKSQQAWELIHQLFQGQVTRWVRRHPSFSYTGEDESYFVNRALEKLWQAVPPERFPLFPDLKRLLGYLQLCVHSVITDYTRAGELAEVESDLEQEDDSGREDPPDRAEHAVSVEERVEARSQMRELWKVITERLHDSREVEVAYAAFVLDLKPAEMMECYPGHFQSIKEIYRIKENLLERLRRDHELRSLLQIRAEFAD